MRHKKKGRALNRTQSHRRSLLSNLITSLFQHERIRTTTAKAKEARPLAEKLITFAKRGDLHARRQVLRFIHDKEVVVKLFDKISARFKDRPGGYTRVLKLGNRYGDNADMAFLELVQEEAAAKEAGKRRRRSKKKPAAAAAPAQEMKETAQAGAAADQTQEAAETQAENAKEAGGQPVAQGGEEIVSEPGSGEKEKENKE
ncbi:MAG TPA: 50S ribosomal protein L17 [Candidatus Glassbacteria bacterium]|nr:50S ribosomal protein L17 [Candidatus Glassbacteria bacterium]